MTVSESALKSNRVPTLAICGEHDPVKATVLAMKDAVPNLSVQVITGLDHNTLPGSKEFRGGLRDFVLADGRSR